MILPLQYALASPNSNALVRTICNQINQYELITFHLKEQEWIGESNIENDDILNNLIEEYKTNYHYMYINLNKHPIFDSYRIDWYQNIFRFTNNLSFINIINYNLNLRLAFKNDLVLKINYNQKYIDIKFGNKLQIWQYGKSKCSYKDIEELKEYQIQ